MTLIPTLLWAQRKDRLFLTIDLQDAKDPKVVLENDEKDEYGKLTFSGTAEGQPYLLEVEFFKAIDKDASKISISPRHVFLMVLKKGDSDHWPRLTKDSGRHLSHIKCDWDKWVDEDDEEEGVDNFDPSQLNNFESLADFQPPADQDSDDEDLPDLAS